MGNKTGVQGGILVSLDWSHLDRYVPYRLRRSLGSILLTSAKATEFGNYIVVVLNGTYVGVAKRNPTDEFVFETGARIAMTRALRILKKGMGL